jgi:hypothetical protein
MIEFSLLHSFVLFFYFKNNAFIILSAGGLLVPEGIIHPVVSVSALTSDMVY